METMNKQFKYRGIKFNIKVELNTRVERRIDGTRYHTITTNCVGHTQYYKTDVIADKYLTMEVHDAERRAMQYTDEQFDGVPTTDKRLTDLGFM